MQRPELLNTIFEDGLASAMVKLIKNRRRLDRF